MSTAPTKSPLPSPRPPAADDPLPRRGEGGDARGDALPRVCTALSPAEVVERLEGAARRGRLPGFAREGERGFRATVFGEPFDRDLHGVAGEREGGGSAIEFTLTLRRKFPVIAGVVTLLTLWPGVWLTHSMLGVYFGGYPRSMWVTLAWYVPLVVAPLPWMLRRMWRKSELVARVEREKTIDKIVAEVRGEVDGRR